MYAAILNEKQKASNPKKQKDKQRHRKMEQEEMIRMRNGSVSSLGKVKELWCMGRQMTNSPHHNWLGHQLKGGCSGTPVL